MFQIIETGFVFATTSGGSRAVPFYFFGALLTSEAAAGLVGLLDVAFAY